MDTASILSRDLGLTLVQTSLLSDPDHHYGRKAPDGCVAIRVMDQDCIELRAANLPDPGDNATGNWFWVRATLTQARTAIAQLETTRENETD